MFVANIHSGHCGHAIDQYGSHASKPRRSLARRLGLHRRGLCFAPRWTRQGGRTSRSARCRRSLRSPRHRANRRDPGRGLSLAPRTGAAVAPVGAQYRGWVTLTGAHARLPRQAQVDYFWQPRARLGVGSQSLLEVKRNVTEFVLKITHEGNL